MCCWSSSQHTTLCLVAQYCRICSVASLSPPQEGNHDQHTDDIRVLSHLSSKHSRFLFAYSLCCLAGPYQWADGLFFTVHIPLSQRPMSALLVMLSCFGRWIISSLSYKALSASQKLDFGLLRCFCTLLIGSLEGNTYAYDFAGTCWS
jgi:hypothetical protein